MNLAAALESPPGRNRPAIIVAPMRIPTAAKVEVLVSRATSALWTSRVIPSAPMASIDSRLALMTAAPRRTPEGGAAGGMSMAISATSLSQAVDDVVVVLLLIAPGASHHDLPGPVGLSAGLLRIADEAEHRVAQILRAGRMHVGDRVLGEVALDGGVAERDHRDAHHRVLHQLVRQHVGRPRIELAGEHPDMDAPQLAGHL